MDSAGRPSLLKSAHCQFVELSSYLLLYHAIHGRGSIFSIQGCKSVRKGSTRTICPPVCSKIRLLLVLLVLLPPLDFCADNCGTMRTSRQVVDRWQGYQAQAICDRCHELGLAKAYAGCTTLLISLWWFKSSTLWNPLSSSRLAYTNAIAYLDGAEEGRGEEAANVITILQVNRRQAEELSNSHLNPAGEEYIMSL